MCVCVSGLEFSVVTLVNILQIAKTRVLPLVCCPAALRVDGRKTNPHVRFSDAAAAHTSARTRARCIPP